MEPHLPSGDVTKSPSTRNPSAPFTTSTLQQEANSKLGLGSKATMAGAQRLYQDGKITYMRTDSITCQSRRLPKQLIILSGSMATIISHVRNFKTKSAGAQEAHEAIRPTDMTREDVSGSATDQKIYDLIRRRTLASQMAPAKLERTTATITISTAKEVFEAKGEAVVFDGFMRVYGAKDDTLLPALSAKDLVSLFSVEARQVFARPPARYSEGALVKKLEELGIGRPSTYATIIDTIQTRGYALRGEDEGTPRDVVVLSAG